MRTARALAAVAAALAAPAMAAGWSSSARGASPLPPPALPSQPGLAATFCSPTPGAAGQWTALTSDTGPTGTPLEQVTVDPWTPCRLYRAPDDRSLERSADSGRTWQRIFSDQARAGVSGASWCTGGTLPAAVCDLAMPRFSASSIAVGRSGEVLLGERGNGDAAVSSTDAGRTWTLADSGIEHLAIGTVAVAPSDPTVGYAAAISPATAASGPAITGLFVTRDSGAQWSAIALPASFPSDLQLDALQVDATDAGRLWTLGHTAAQATLYEVDNYGQNWGSRDLSLPSGSIGQMLVTESPTHGTRVFLAGSFSSPRTGLLHLDVARAATGAVVWVPAPVPPATGSIAVAADPAQQDRMLVVEAAPQLRVLRSLDGFDSATPVPAPVSQGTPDVATPLDGLSADPPSAVLQADLFGQFYVTVRTCGASGCRSGEAQRQTLWRYASPAPPRQSGAAGSSPPPSPPQALPLGTTLNTCQLPPPPSTSTGGDYGSLAFDGHALLYTHIDETGSQPLTGVIHRMDALTCSDAGTLTVHFQRSELVTLQAAQSYGYGDHPVIDDLTYDPRRNVIWASLRLGGAQPTGSWLFRVTIPDPGHPLDAVAHLAFQNGCGFILSYDFYRDTLWTCDGPNVGRIRASDGASVGSCMPDVWSDPQAFPQYGPATWAVGGPERLYLQGEDDSTVKEYDVDRVDHPDGASMCHLVSTQTHRRFTEPIAEDEQLVCDPVTFAGSASPIGRGPVLWIRDADASLVAAYLLPDGCPLPTATTYVGTTRVLSGATAELCATVTLRGTGRPIAALPVDLSLDGVDVGVVATDAAGLACLPDQVALPQGRYPLEARFAGSITYLPSSADAWLTVDVLLGPPRPPSLHPPAALPLGATATPPAPPPAPIAQAASASQAQTEAQAQAQAQAEVQTQGATQTVAQLQPGVMVERQRAPQVAVATAHVQPSVAMAWRTRHASGALALVSTATGLAFATRRRRCAPARSEQRWRPPPRHSP